MKVAVITPYYKEPLEMLLRCHESVLQQTYPCVHFMVADGHPKEEVASWSVQHSALAVSHADAGNTPRSFGGMSAFNQGFDAVAYLDADNWYASEHIESLVEVCQNQKVAVAFADRQLILPTGELCHFDDKDVLERKHVDTSCFFITAAAASLAPLWGMIEPNISAACDRVLFHVIKQRAISYGWSKKKTLYFETRYAPHFKRMGQPPPPDEHWFDWAAIRASYSPERSFARLGFHLFSEAAVRKMREEAERYLSRKAR